jgi:hypothetical protein
MDMNGLLRRSLHERRSRDAEWLEERRDRAEPTSSLRSPRRRSPPREWCICPTSTRAFRAGSSQWPEWELVDGQPMRVWDLDELKRGSR